MSRIRAKILIDLSLSAHTFEAFETYDVNNQEDVLLQSSNTNTVTMGLADVTIDAGAQADTVSMQFSVMGGKESTPGFTEFNGTQVELSFSDVNILAGADDDVSELVTEYKFCRQCQCHI